MSSVHSVGQTPRLSIDFQATATPISPLLFGIFYEDLNHAGEGGLHAELLRNRAMNHPELLQGWTMFCEGASDGTMGPAHLPQQNPVNVWALRLEILSVRSGRVGVRNEGFYGVPICAGASYTLTLDAWCIADFAGPLLASLESSTGECYAVTEVSGLGTEKQRLTLTLTSNTTDAEAFFVLSSTATGVIWCDFVSLFPTDTWKGRPFGLRRDLAEMMEAMQPSFVRFPGGCYVEGDDLSQAFRWKENLGDPALRKGHWNRWGYYTSAGLGFHEYLQMCEDLHAEPLFVVNAGMSHTDKVCGEALIWWIDDTLDAIEYANGAPDTPWGAKRAALHHEPFGLKYIEIGNENAGAIYEENYPRFYHAIKERYPEIQVVCNHYYPGLPADIIDEHDFADAAKFHAMHTKFDSYDRQRPKIYFGEYACANMPTVGTLAAALAEAVFMAGMERNGDHVIMASYAPLFVHRQDRHWENDAIVFDGLNIVATPSYEVQRLFSQRRVTAVLPYSIEGAPDLYASAGYAASGEFILKLINVGGEALQLDIPCDGDTERQVRTEILWHEDPMTTNSFLETPLTTRSDTQTHTGDTLPFVVPPYSLSILTFSS